MTDTNHLLKRGDAYFLEGLFDKAIANFTQVIEMGERTPQVYISRARVYSSKALTDLQPVPLNDESEHSKWQNALLNSSTLQMAFSDIDMALKLDPSCADAYFGKGIILNDIGDYSGAIKSLTKYQELRPNDSVGYYHRAISYSELGKADVALGDINESIRLNSKFSAAYFERSLLYSMQQEYHKALADINSAIELEPSAVYSLERAKITLQLLSEDAESDELPEVMDDLNTAIEMDPQFGEAYAIRASIYHATQNRECELKDLSALIALTPNDADAYKRRAACHKACGNTAAASSDLQRFKALSREKC